MRRRFSPFVLKVAAAAALAGCASVNVVKVTGDPQPEGIPFYLPRPYVQVFEPFVIGSKDMPSQFRESLRDRLFIP